MILFIVLIPLLDKEVGALRSFFVSGGTQKRPSTWHRPLRGQTLYYVVVFLFSFCHVSAFSNIIAIDLVCDSLQ